MWLIFGSIVGLWIIIEGIKLVIAKTDLKKFSHDLLFIIIAAGLMSGQGPGLVDAVYSASLTTMSGAASAILTVGTIGTKTAVATDMSSSGVASGIGGLDGMTGLVSVAEHGVMQVFSMAVELIAEVSLTNVGIPALYGVLLALPYFLLLVVYFAQVVVSIFRVMMIAALSPILMLAFGFEWGRGMAFTALRTLFAAFMVLYGATVALAVCLYGVAALNVADPALTGDVSEIASFNNPTLLVAIILGWLGTAFMAEATGMANSIAGSQLTNTAAAIITAGATATGMTLITKAAKAAKNLNGNTKDGQRDLMDWMRGKPTPSGDDSNLSRGAQQIKDRLTSEKFDRD
jgi:type IV secretion system protein TrbL